MKSIQCNDKLNSLIDGIRNARLLMKKIKKQEEQLLIDLALEMKDKEAVISDDGETIVTYKHTKDAEIFDSKRFRAENEELYEQYKTWRAGSRRLVLNKDYEGFKLDSF